MEPTENTVAPSVDQTGQVAVPPVTDGQGDAAPVIPDGQVAVPDGTTPQAGDSVADGRYDYGQMTSEQVHKHWQGEYTKKSQELAELRKQMEPMLEIQRNPLPAIQQYLQQYGYQVVRQGANNPDDPYGDPQPQPGVDPNMLLSQMQQYVNQQITPLQQSLQQQVVNNVVQELNTSFPEWEQYEGPIKSNLAKYPNLAHDIDALYNMSVPQQVREARVYQKFLEDQKRRETTSLPGPAATTPPAVTPDEGTAGDWEKSWAYAKQQVGIK